MTLQDADPVYDLGYNDVTIAAHITMRSRGRYACREDMLQAMVISLAQEKAELKRLLEAAIANSPAPVILTPAPYITAKKVKP